MLLLLLLFELVSFEQLVRHFVDLLFPSLCVLLAWTPEHGLDPFVVLKPYLIAGIHQIAGFRSAAVDSVLH